MADIPNLDYIGTIETEGEHVEFKRYQIPSLQSLLIEMENIVADDSKTVLDLQRMVEEKYSSQDEYLESFLAPIDYDDRFVDSVSSPNLISRDQLKQQYKEMLGSLSNLQKPFEICYVTWLRGDYGPQKSVEKRKVPKAVGIQYNLREWNRRNKVLFFSKFRRYAYSSNYLRVLKDARIKDRLGQSVKMFTTDTIGWTTYTYQINDDIVIQFDSNFAYGRSSYFYLSLLYKGIEILPLSSCVRYRYANVRTLMWHTRSYPLERSSWKAALEFVVEHANKAIEAPDDFVRQYIGGEIDAMLTGMKQILEATSFEDCINKFEDENAEYLGVTSNIGKFECRLMGGGLDGMDVRQEEMLVLLKTEKITGMLALLEKIRALEPVANRVSAAVSEIVLAVKGILPEVVETLNSCKQDIELKNQRIAELDLQAGEFLATLNVYDESIKRIQELRVSEMNRDGIDNFEAEADRIRTEVRCDYEQQHPEYKDAKKRLQECKNKKAELTEIVSKREVFVTKLETCYGVGMSGGQFAEIIEKLMPHLAWIESEVQRQIEGSNGMQRSVIQVEALRKAIQEQYVEAHSDLSPLFSVRDKILSKINEYVYNDTDRPRKGGRNV